MGIKQLFKRTTYNASEAPYTSIEVSDRTCIESFVANAKNTFLVSFPRTGSHWLRMLMELYFGRPSLVRVFYYPERKDYLTLHTHDLQLDVERANVIYLYRDPVDTIYSQLRYHNEDTSHRGRIAYWADLYGRHLDKWLHKETFTDLKTVLRYERLRIDILKEFNRVCNHFKSPLNEQRLKDVAARVSKEKVKEKTPHDPQVIDLSRDYEESKKIFQATHSEFIWQVLLNKRKYLLGNFESNSTEILLS